MCVLHIVCKYYLSLIAQNVCNVPFDIRLRRCERNRMMRIRCLSHVQLQISTFNKEFNSVRVKCDEQKTYISAFISCFTHVHYLMILLVKTDQFSVLVLGNDFCYILSYFGYTNCCALIESHTVIMRFNPCKVRLLSQTVNILKSSEINDDF